MLSNPNACKDTRMEWQEQYEALVSKLSVKKLHI